MWDGSAIVVVTNAGTVPLDDYIARAVGRLPPLAALPEAEPPKVTRPCEPRHARGRNDFFGNLTRGWAVAEQAATLKEALKGPNPWAPEHLNRTRQTVIRNLNPELAEQLKIKAGVA